MNATMRRILLAGAPTGCWTNLGDEAILAGMTTSLRATWSEVALTVVSSNPPGFLDRYDCQAVPFRDVEAIAEAVAASDLVLLGGGSIFYDYWACDPGATLTPRHAADVPAGRDGPAGGRLPAAADGLRRRGRAAEQRRGQAARRSGLRARGRHLSA